MKNYWTSFKGKNMSEETSWVFYIHRIGFVVFYSVCYMKRDKRSFERQDTSTEVVTTESQVS